MLTLRPVIKRVLRRLVGCPAQSPPLDRTGPATVYPDRTGAWAPTSPPSLEVARARIRVWRRFRHLWGWR